MSDLILICDDEERATRDWHAQLQELPVFQDGSRELDELSKEDLADAVRQLESRQAAQRHDIADGLATGGGSNPIDSASILIVDFDLLQLRDSDSRSASETGERIAYLARCYSTCGFIVALNQFDRGAPVFDLTLRGHPRSFADLNISSTQLANPGLWSDERSAFRPWSWPYLPTASARLEARAAAIADRMGEPILATLGLDSNETLPHFSREQLRYLGNHGNPVDATFDDLIDNSILGLTGKDVQTDVAMRARVAAARVHKWLERSIVPGQNILIDLPHLVSRFPSLVPDGSTHIEAWQALAGLSRSPALPAAEHLEAARFDHETWLARPAWIWPKLQQVSAIAEVRDPWSERFNDFNFAEDLSQFVPAEQSRDFAAEVDSPWNTRFVLDASSIPVDDPRRTGPYSVDHVRYEPGIQFSL